LNLLPAITKTLSTLLPKIKMSTNSFSVATLFPERVSPDIFRDICRSIAANTQSDDTAAFCKAASSMLTLINRTDEENKAEVAGCLNPHNDQLFRIFVYAIKKVHGWSPILDSFKTILAKGDRVITKSAIIALDEILSFDFSLLPKWCLNPYNKLAFDQLDAYRQTSLAAPFAVACNDGIRSEPPINYVDQLTESQIDAWDLQGAVTALEARQDFVQDQVGLCNFEEFIDLLAHPSVTHISSESYKQLNEFYGGLHFGCDNRDRTRKDLCPLMKRIVSKVTV
jgi:hypothetical protein